MSVDFKKIKELSLEPIQKESFGPWAFFMLIAILPFFSMLAYLSTGFLAEKQEQDIDGRFMESMEITMHNRKVNIERWLEGIPLIAKPITYSKTIQIFTMDINESQKDKNFEGILEQRKLRIEKMLADFVSQNDLIQAYLINRRAQVYTNFENSKYLSEGYKERARSVFIDRQVSYSPLRMDGEKVLMDVFVPIFSFKDSKNREKITASRDNPVNGYGVTGVLVMTLSVKDALQDLIAANVQLLKGQKIYVFQGISGGVQMVRLGHEHEGIFSQDKDMMTHENLKKVWDIYYLNEGKHDLSKMPHFGASSQTMPRPGEILMRKQKIERLPLTMMVYLNLHTAYQDLLLQRRQLHLIGQLIALLLFVFILAFWWKMQDKRHSLLAKQYLEFSKKINAQRHLLISINSAVNEHITLKYFDGKYVYVNKAFAKFLGLQVEDILHKSDYALFSGKIAEELRDMDKRLLRNKKTVFQENDFKVRGHRYYLAISKTPFLDGNRKFVGIITVVKDLTEVASERQLREKAINNSMQSMMRIMQRHDDHLVKHIEYLKSLTLNLADRLNLSTEDKTTLEVASNLSQLGKIYVSKDILNASGELNDRDLAIYRKHIEDTAFILDTVDWGLPVVDTVYTMHEKLDGTGYPNNLRAPDISKLSRILAICDCFCKLVIPRRGHKVFTPEEAIKWMVNQKGKYDLSIIQSFAEMITEDESIALVG